MTTKLLVAFDGRDHSVAALDKAAELATEGAEVTVLSVVGPDARGTKSGGHVGFAPHADADVAYAQDYLRTRGVQAETAVAHGDPADEIVRSAESGGYDTIVVGTRGLGPVLGRVFRSVSREVAQRVPRRVIVAR